MTNKNSNVFEIHRWDSILLEKLGYSVPMIYIKPTTELIIYGQKMNYCFNVKIDCPGSIYNNEIMKATLDSLVMGPNCTLPAFQNKEFYTLTLDSYFYEYPVNMGNVTILDLPKGKITENYCGGNALKDREIIPSSIKNNMISKEIGMNVNSLIFLVTIIFFISLIIFLIYQNLRK